METEERKVYLQLGSMRLLDIIVKLDGYEDENIIYDGWIEDAPEEIKQLKYSEVRSGTKMTYIVFSDCQ